MESRLLIRRMRRGEVDLAVEWAAAEGWNPGIHDAEAFLGADPAGFLMGFLGDCPIGCISAVAYENHFGFLGFYIVAPGERRKGYGLQLWRQAMHKLQGRNVALDGVFSEQENYRRSGFELAYRNIRFEFANKAGALPAGLTPLTEVPAAALARYDRRCFPAARGLFLERWVRLEGSVGLALVEAGDLKGYGVVRPCRRGYKIGPLFADRRREAQRLLAGLCACVPAGAPIYLDVPEVNAEGMRLAGDYKMQAVFGTARMYTGGAPSVDLDKVFGVTSFELG